MKSSGRKLTEKLAQILADRAAELNLSLREIQALSGVPFATVGRVLDAKTSITMDKFEPIARALGLKPWQVMRQAEEELRRESAQAIAEDFATKLRAGMTPEELGLAAKTREIDPLDARGEESQVPPGWDE